MSYTIVTDACIACGACAKKCPENAIFGKVKVGFEIDPFVCMDCGNCFDTCKRGAIEDPFGDRSAVRNRKQENTKAVIDSEICAGCKICFMNCPQEAISIIKKGLFTGSFCQVDSSLCVGCGTCTEYCITGAVSLEKFV
ncbi:Putative ferredoxin, Iron-sulfur binding protein [Desulfamplus magnetovallimortis]|uniref:Putative ferredoxin, Iron-sulfur binding protein n=1 Tax=Desulfamplus magnetovallimortis TaxID=1246637 RepID=L0R6R3_9BACT|nr:4Fe-4S binding protein [Desulfamplus magnetovallimortis]CCO06691.1 Putative ferredoxin, Iron-sulfur binding protein [Desulfamplus magnetovallimortis BW-1]SLM32742.1 Putative ferredoxin, Iron-sulfur binding protein [Desulfamplus magnetovallimortis]